MVIGVSVSKAPIDPIDPKEAAKRRRELILIFAVTVLFALTTYVEIRLSNLSNRLPFVNSIFFFGLINFNIILLMVMLFLIFRNVGKVFLERRRKLFGTRLKTKLIAAFLSFTIIPTTILFLISSLYINSSFDKWFSIKVQNTLQAALEITQTYYKNTSRIAQHLATQSANDLRADVSARTFRVAKLKKLIDKNRETSAVDGLEVYNDPMGERIVSSNQPDADRGSEQSVPRLPLDVLNKAFAGDSVSLVQHIGRADLIRALAPVVDPASGEVVAAVGVTFVIPISLVNRVDEIASVFQDYKDVNPLKYPMKSTYFVILITMTALIVFASVWIGLYLARELTVPLERLVTATQKISEGNLDFEILNPGNDEIARLTESFNTMTGEIKRHRGELEERRAYVEAILNHVTAGVVSIDSTGVITTVNPSAAKLLGIDRDAMLGKPVSRVFAGDHEVLAQMFDQLRSAAGSSKILQKQFAKSGADDEESYTTLSATASSLENGAVIVIDDTSHLFKVQREAAWREVARRIAHEIKNPLTPIKLSAQRLQKKFASSSTSDSSVFRECTDTIIKNVDELRDMVNEFSNFARLPTVNPTRNNLNEAIREVVVLFEEAHRSIAFVYEPETRLPILAFDRDQIKRVMINLLDNAVAVLANGVGEKKSLPKRITITTHFNEQLQLAMIDVEDNGPGMTDQVRGRLFEPYFSTKANGTGLGLAIVKRIVSDHQGFIRVQSEPDGGTKFTVELPANLLENDYARSRKEGQSAWLDKS